MSLMHKMGILLKSLRLKYVQSEEEKKKFHDISVEEAQKKYEVSKNDYIWLDVRTQGEYSQRHIPGSKLIPIDQLEDRIGEVGSKDKKYIVYCHSGGRSVAACMILHDKGYKQLFNMPGMSYWNGPTES